MSISLYVYSPDPPLDQELLAKTFRDPRQPADFRWEVVIDGETVFGWRPGSRGADRARAAVLARDRAALEALTVDETLASLGLYVTTSDHPGWIVDEELLEATPPEHRAAVRATKTHYNVETGARRNDLSIVFQEHVWRTIGVLSNGLMEDPQAGEYTTKDGDVTQPESRIDGVEKGRRLFTAAVIVLLLAEAISLPFDVQRVGLRELWKGLVQLGLLAMFWYLVRTGESLGYWALVTLAFGVAAMWTWVLLTPPSSPFGWTALLALRVVMHIGAGIMLVLPATIAYVRARRLTA